MRSFFRQLNQYSFAKQPIDMSTTRFSHPRFLLGRKDLLRHVQRRAPGEPAVTAELLGDEVFSNTDNKSNVSNQPVKACGTKEQDSIKIPSKEKLSVAKCMLTEYEANGAFARACSSRAKRSNGSSMQKESEAGLGRERSPVMHRTSGRITQATTKVRASMASDEDSSEMEDTEEEGGGQSNKVSELCSSVLAKQKKEDIAVAGAALVAQPLVKRVAATKGFVSEPSTWPIGCAIQSDLKDPIMTAHPATLGGEGRGDGASALSDYSDLFLGSNIDFVLPFSDLSEWNGDAFDLDDTFVPDLGQVQEYSDGGRAEIQPCVLSQSSGDNNTSPQWKAPAEANYQQISLTQKLGFNFSMLPPLPPSLPLIVEKFERQSGVSSSNGGFPVTAGSLSTLMDSSYSKEGDEGIYRP
jgi:hypothetical protein